MDHELFGDAETFIEHIPTTGPAFVYVLYGAGTPYIKIGSTENIAARLASLQTGCPHRLHLLFSVFCADARGLETLMHEYFAEYRLHGDWFQLPDDPPRILELLAFLYSQSHRTVQRDERHHITLDNTDETSRILELLKDDHAFTIPQILEGIGLDETEYTRVRRALLRLFHKGRIGKNGRGRYRLRTETREDSN